MFFLLLLLSFPLLSILPLQFRKKTITFWLRNQISINLCRWIDFKHNVQPALLKGPTYALGKSWLLGSVRFCTFWNIDHWPLPPCLVHDQQPASHFILNPPLCAHLQTAFEYIINGLTVAQEQFSAHKYPLLPLSAFNQYELQSKLVQLI